MRQSCERLQQLCGHPTHAEIIQKLCPVTCGVCIPLSPLPPPSSPPSPPPFAPTQFTMSVIVSLGATNASLDEIISTMAGLAGNDNPTNLICVGSGIANHTLP